MQYNFCGNRDTFFHDSLLIRKFKRTAFIWKIFLVHVNFTVVKVFTFTFDQLNVSFLNKSMNLSK